MFYTVVSAPLSSGTYAVINGVIGYVSAKRNTMLNFYYAVSDFFRLANQYDAEMDEEEKEALLNQSLKEKLFRKIKKAYNEIRLLSTDSEIKKDIDGIYAHCVKEEEVIRALVDSDAPKKGRERGGNQKETAGKI